MSNIFKLDFLFKNSKNKEVKKLLKNLKDWKKNNTPKNYQINKDLDVLLDLWNKKLEKEYFELEHPENSQILTRAVKNIQFGMTNLVFMIDKENKHPWILAQCTSFIDMIITQNGIYKIPLSNFAVVSSSILKLKDFNPKDVYYKDIKYGFLLSQKSPFHFFYDHLKYLNYFYNKNFKKTICYDNPFFRLFDDNKTNEEKVYLFPSLIGQNQSKNISKQKLDDLNKSMEKAVYTQAIKSLDKIQKNTKNENYDLILWYGITGQKRSWIEQIEGFEQIVNKLKQSFPKIKIYIDGMTASDDKTIQNKEDEEVYKKLKKPFENDKTITITSLIGQDYKTKICYASTIDIFIANGGTGCMVPLKFCQKAGVIHSSSLLRVFGKVNTKLVKSVDDKMIIDITHKNNRVDFASYFIPWQHIFNLLAEVLEELKDIKIKRLELPNIDKLRAKYQKNSINSDIFMNLERKIKPNSKAEDILREVALSFEKKGNIKTALDLMEEALILRPNGKVIKQKVVKYKEILKK